MVAFDGKEIVMIETLFIAAMLVVFCCLVVLVWMRYSSDEDTQQDEVGDVPTISQFYHRWEDRL